jgi:hypothetical protein
MLLYGDLDKVGGVVCSACVLWNDVVPVKNGHVVVCGLCRSFTPIGTQYGNGSDPNICNLDQAWAAPQWVANQPRHN